MPNLNNKSTDFFSNLSEMRQANKLWDLYVEPSLFQFGDEQHSIMPVGGQDLI